MTQTMENTRIYDEDCGWGTIAYVSKHFVFVVWDNDPTTYEQMSTADAVRCVPTVGHGLVYTAENITEKLEANDWEDTEFLLADGSVAVVSPCMFGEGEDRRCEYYLIDHEFPWLSDGTAEAVANTFNNICEIRKEHEEEEQKLNKYFDDHNGHWNDDSASFYSDWHKDVYGYRPRVW